jgi:RNA polymerase sigma factor (sigma-70 family)
MEQESTLAPIEAFSRQYARLIDWLHAEANCARWSLARSRFAEALRRSVEKRYGGARPDVAEVEAYLKSLHVEDLALAYACADGEEAAWEFFVAHFRQELRAAASAILRASGAGDDVRAEELADSLYAELYGVTPTGSGRRKSLFEYFHGRSKLSTWLRAVLAQRHVDLLRKSWRTVSLEAEEDKAPGNITAGSKRNPHLITAGSPLKLGLNTWSTHSQAQRADASPPDPARERYLARLDRGLRAAIAGLAPRERMLLACYYVDQLTLAEIGRTLGEHESTVSRQLDRIRRQLRESVTKTLLHGAPAQDGHGPEAGLDGAQVELVFEYALEDWPFELSRALSKTEAAVDPPEK